MQRTIQISKNSFKPSKPLFVGSSTGTTVVTRPMSILRSENSPMVTKKYNKTMGKLIIRSMPMTTAAEASNVITSHLSFWQGPKGPKVITVKGLPSNKEEPFKFTARNQDQVLNFMQFQQSTFRALVSSKAAPHVAIMDGITMGEGAALSLQGGFRVATEHTRLIVPELSLGRLLSAGCSFALARLDGQLGVYLALTGQPMSGQDLLFSNLATHFIPSSSIEQMEHSLSKLDSRRSNFHDINSVLDQFASTQVSRATDGVLNAAKRRTIDTCFDRTDVDEIISALEQNGSPFALETRDFILKNSLQASQDALEKLQRAKFMSLDQCIALDFESAKDTHNPVTHGLDSKDTTTNDISPFTLPTEDDIRRYIVGLTNMDSGFLKPATSLDQIVSHFQTQKQAKIGVVDKVKEVLERKARIVSNKSGASIVEWNY